MYLQLHDNDVALCALYSLCWAEHMCMVYGFAMCRFPNRQNLCYQTFEKTKAYILMLITGAIRFKWGV